MLITGGCFVLSTELRFAQTTDTLFFGDRYMYSWLCTHFRPQHETKITTILRHQRGKVEAILKQLFSQTQKV